MKSNWVKIILKNNSGPEYLKDKIINRLKIKKGENIVCIGCNCHLFTMEFADLVGDRGNIYAVSKNKLYLNFLQKEKKGQNKMNIKCVPKKNREELIPNHKVNKIFFLNCIHKIKNRIQFFINLKKYLVYQGEVICIEKEKLDRFSLSSLIKYYISEDKIIEEMKGAGYYLVIKYDFIPDQSFTIFSPYS